MCDMYLHLHYYSVILAYGDFVISGCALRLHLLWCASHFRFISSLSVSRSDTNTNMKALRHILMILNCSFLTAVIFVACLLCYWEVSMQHIFTYSSKQRSEQRGGVRMFANSILLRNYWEIFLSSPSEEHLRWAFRLTYRFQKDPACFSI